MSKPIKLTKPKTIILGEREAVLVNGDSLQINQLKWDAKNDFDYDSVYLTKEQILKLAEELTKGDNNND